MQECLHALDASTCPPHEIIIVDDASDDGAAQSATRFSVTLIRLAERRGPAFARNRGAERASGNILLFIDADVRCRPETLCKVMDVFALDPRLDAVIGSYDDAPPAPNFLSKYKNLTHHFVHQQACPEASTFWAGCGAIRREVFRAMGGFDETYRRPSIEDIDLGYRMRQAGRLIALRRDIQVGHAKVWTLGTMLRSDILDRALPWTRLQLKHGRLLNDLNLAVPQRIASVAALLFAVCAAVGFFRPRWWIAAAFCALALAAINRRLYGFYLRQGGWRFALGSAGMHVTYYLYSLAAFGVGCLQFLISRLVPRTGAAGRTA